MTNCWRLTVIVVDDRTVPPVGLGGGVAREVADALEVAGITATVEFVGLTAAAIAKP